MIKKFSEEVSAKLGYYVYRLIDPRNGQTFYVGKGKGNRVFYHVKNTIEYYDGVEDKNEDDPNKLRIIKEILDDGLEVIHVIQRWNLTEKEAFEVESALIDSYQGLSNIQSGHHTEYGVTSAEVLERNLSLNTYEEPKDFKYLIIKVRNSYVEKLTEEFTKTSRYEATRKYWAIKPRSIKEYPYVFSVSDGIVKEVYEIKEWIGPTESGRYEFVGELAPNQIRKEFRLKRIPEEYCKKGMASPVLYSKTKN